MKKILIKSISLENFKGCKNKVFNFNGNTIISGANATGKTTILDAFWWCLFNKDSLGNEKFSIRPLGADGKQIDNVEIRVSVLLDIDGEEMEITKVQKQKWVKKRGTDVTELQGNENLYEIDGFPKSEKDYKSAISDIISEDVFKMVTNPTYFPSLKWKEQRDILMRFISEMSDYELAGFSPNFTLLRSDLKKANTDDIAAKYKKALLEWKKKQAEIPVRIDEAEKSKVDIDVAELNLCKNALNEQIENIKIKQVECRKVADEHAKLSSELAKLKADAMDLQRKSNEGNNSKRNDLVSQITNKEYLLKLTNSTIADTQRLMDVHENRINAISKNIDGLRKEYSATQKAEFDENSLVCSCCGQEYPMDKKEQIKAEFEEIKQSKLAEIEKKGNDFKSMLEDAKNQLEKDKAEMAEHKKSAEMLTSAISDLKSELSKIPMSVDVSETDEYKDVHSQIKEKEKALASLILVDDCSAELSDLQAQLVEIEKRIALANKNIEIDERILELQAEQKDVAQKVANQEQMLYILEEFIRFKMDKYSSDINSKFDGLNFKLFENQINGGLKETCELTVNGVPYGSLNNGHRIIAGLQIIKALQGLYGVLMPVFIDNAESVNDFNLPTMDCQLILLKVSEDKEIKVEVSR